MYETLEKFFLSYGAYQLVVFIILSTMDDIKKGSTLMKISLLKLCILYRETGAQELKAKVVQLVDLQFFKSALNDE